MRTFYYLHCHPSGRKIIGRIVGKLANEGNRILIDWNNAFRKWGDKWIELPLTCLVRLVPNYASITSESWAFGIEYPSKPTRKGQ